jgi:hypothetical protein
MTATTTIELFQRQVENRTNVWLQEGEEFETIVMQAALHLPLNLLALVWIATRPIISKGEAHK